MAGPTQLNNDSMPATVDNDSLPDNAEELFGVVYLADVPTHSAVTTIWPGSPQAL